jgi:signal transduction histidine kinase
VILADVLHSGTPTIVETAGHVLLVAIPLLAAEAVRTHRTYLALLQDRLELAERTRAQEAQRRAEQERMRIARELHDVVAHTLTTINVQAGATAERVEASEARDVLEQIERTSHDAIGELRAILGVLRDPDGAAAPRSPAPGVENISELVERARSAGQEVELNVAGHQPAQFSDAVSLAAYRIVQESLTNAQRHAADAPVRVDLEFGGTLLSITVDNPVEATHRSNGAVPGVGIVGMLERASAVGGTLTAGQIPGGFRVQAELPFELNR